MLAGFYSKTTGPIFTKFGGKVEHGPRKKPPDVGGSPDDVRVRRGSATRRMGECMLPGVLE